MGEIIINKNFKLSFAGRVFGVINCVSYGVYVVQYDVKTGVLKFNPCDYSKTTLEHINKFLDFINQPRINKKLWEELQRC